jgi:cephalosporin hydroxylase/glycosyltransferase involved in cell wall biosynthesis
MPPIEFHDVIGPLALLDMAAETDAPAFSAPEAWVDGCIDGVIHGWAWWPHAPEQRAVVEIVVGGKLVGDGVACLKRGDLTGVKGAGDQGFAVAFDPEFAKNWPDGRFEAVVRLRGGAMLPGGRLVLGPADRAPVLKSTARAEIWPAVPVTLARAGITGFIDHFGPAWIRGWAQHVQNPSAPVAFSIWDGDERVGAFRACLWREDLEAVRLGDGRWGIQAEVPATLRDGRLHSLDVRLDDGTSVLDALLHVRFAAPDPRLDFLERQLPTQDSERPSLRHRPDRTDVPAATLFSIVVNFYNMPREAARTLTSLSRAYQRGIGTLPYEVLCIDNGSDPPLDEAWIRSFGPEFRLLRPARRSASPCAAINLAVAEASGQYVAIMIDGAHVLTPGVLREVWDAVTEAPEAVVGVRQWFVGGDQRWLASIGYSRAQEDILFDKIAWPADGYKLFKVGAPVWESPNHWFDGMIESNCLVMKRALYQQIGGMEEAFDEAGAGYANLDLFRRAADATPEPVVSLVGEASFHQFHDGTTTNVTEEKKEARVRAYENRYVQLRGKGYGGVEPVDIRARGQLRTLAAVMNRQRPASPARLGVTHGVRPGSLALHYDSEAQEYLQSAYAECGLHEQTMWLGHKLDMAPSDAITIQQLVYETRPERIVTVNVTPGVIVFLESLLRLSALHDSRIVAVGTRGACPATAMAIQGDPGARSTLVDVERALGATETIMVLFAPDHARHGSADLVRDYASFVSCRSWLVFLGTVFGQPWLGYSKNAYQNVIRTLSQGMGFAIDHTRNPHLITTSPMGYLQRTGGLVALWDEDDERS